MKVKVVYFAQARETIGKRREIVSLPNKVNVRQLMQLIFERYPNLARMKDTIRIAVNCELVDGETDIKEGDEIALLPPVTGG